MKSALVFQHSYWLLPVCILIGGAYAWLMYSQNSLLNQQAKRGLAFTRAVLVSLICFILLNPLLKSVTNRILKPVLVVAIDNSSSVTISGKETGNKIKEAVVSLKKELEDSPFEIIVKNLDGETINDSDSIRFSGKKTDFGSFFRKTEEEFDGQNLSKVLLISDGIATSGVSPLAKNYPFSIETIGVGDTTIKKDISIKGLIANKLAYLGNSFPVQVEIQANLLAGKSTTIQLSNNGEIIERKPITFSSDQSFQVINFNVQAKDIGKQLYSVSVLPVSEEFTTRNNTRDVLIDVIDGKEKVLIAAQSPHPDLKAMKAILEAHELFEVKIALPGSYNNPENEDFDVLILHQLPSFLGGSDDYVTKLLSKLKPTLFILGSQTDLSRFNGMQQVLNISGQNGRIDKITGSINSKFNRFHLSENYTGILEKLPPINAPFGDYQLFSGIDVILYQRVGTITTDRPLLAINTNVSRKSAVFTATGLWQWRLEEFFMSDKQEAVDDLFLKTLQLISVKENKDKLRVYPIRNEFDVDDVIILQNEAYNDLFERIYDISVNLQVQKSREQPKVFTYDISQSNSRFELSKLAAGIYTYTAEAVILGQKHTATGQFVVKDQDLEHLNTTADFGFLRTLASKNGGNFYGLNSFDLLTDKLKKEEAPGKIISADSLKELINMKWLVIFLIALATTEWVIRKYLGTY
jgi:hypothetical protein